MAKQWKLKPKVPEGLVGDFPEVDPLVLQLLYNRGITEVTEVEKFLNPEYSGLNDPFLFNDMGKAVERVWQAIETGEKVCIYGDYDADAVTANAVLQHTFKYLGLQVGSYIPDRFTEGYGLNIEAFEKIKAGGYTLVITVDCGTNSVDVAEFCKKNGIDLIITDHHEIINGTPDAYALINPKNPGDKYPYHEITGVGVAFKLAQAVLQSADLHADQGRGSARGNNPDWSRWLLDLVAIGTVADCHSLLGENRILVKYGLKVLAKTRWPGLIALAKTAQLDFTQKLPDTYTLGFVIAPRINAAGRLEHADQALNLLMAENEGQSQGHAEHLELVNKRRQDITSGILKQVDNDFKKEENLEARLHSEIKEQAELVADRKIILLMGEDWHRGVVGLVAGRLAQELNRPVIILEKGEEESTGSARSVGNFDILAAIKYGSEHLVRFGGHKQAAGLTLKTKEYDQFYQKLLDYAEINLKPEDLDRVVEMEAELGEGDINLPTLEKISEFEPFGVGNVKPKFLVAACKVLGLRDVGSGQKHLQIQLVKGKKKVSGIGFGMGRYVNILKIGDMIDVAAELIEDGWNGRKDVKLRVVDIKIMES